MCYLSVWLTVCFSVRRNTREHTLPCIFSSCALDGQACACHTKFRMESSISTFNMYFTTSQRHCISDWLDLVKCDVEREQISEENNRPSEQAMRAGERKKTLSHSVNIGDVILLRLSYDDAKQIVVIWSENTSVGGKRQTLLVARASLIKHTGMTQCGAVGLQVKERNTLKHYVSI